MDPIKYKIGYIDEESTWIGVFQRNLGEDFDVVIFPLSEDTTLEGIVNAIQEENLDCLVVDYELKESSMVTFNGDEIIERVRLTNPEFPMLIITGHEENEVVTVVDDADIVRTKNELAERTPLFIKRIKGKILSHRKKIGEIDSEIKSLATKKVEVGLSVLEENRLNDLYKELDRINPIERGLPGVMYERTNITQLSELVKEAQLVLEAIKSKK